MKKVLIFLLIVFALGCAKKQIKTTEEAPAVKEQKTAEERVTPKKDIVEDQLYTAKKDGDIASETEKITAEEAISRDVLFDYDQYDIRSDARPILDSVAAWMNSHKGTSITIEGHCDDRGTNEYNLALGEKRAKAAREYLSLLGVSSGRISIMTYGEERPVCTQSDEECWQKNRRAHFVLIK
jgi:peptidoglycan-associated lipoprotein